MATRQEVWRKSYAKHKDKYWARNLRVWYGITPEDYEAMFDAQKGLCAICGNPEQAGKQLSVDHDHTQNKVRGLLCANCNTGIGKFGDDPSMLFKAVTYLVAHSDYL